MRDEFCLCSGHSEVPGCGHGGAEAPGGGHSTGGQQQDNSVFKVFVRHRECKKNVYHKIFVRTNCFKKNPNWQVFTESAIRPSRSINRDVRLWLDVSVGTRNRDRDRFDWRLVV